MKVEYQGKIFDYKPWAECPFCQWHNYIKTQTGERASGEVWGIECEKCGKPFDAHMHVEVTWASMKLEDGQ